ncbi:helix-turn-helix domain-containing protein [Paenibacillus silvae]|uniref:AraC family transcriptional regulator n=1 Tax=Paenibacillus silvae TaxID=1325358 RepID=A0A2W6NJ06_9BACL|nr:helix-turn-helix domain-containing protein [Paenibacillus silvae]PZT55675.1 hypothetical protein DN757_10520 [Paenibacillus silvae]
MMNSYTSHGPSSLTFALLHIRQLYGQEGNTPRFDGHRLIYITSGQGWLQWKDKPPCPVRSGSCFLLSPETAYYLSMEEEEAPLQGYELVFDGIRIIEAYHAKGQIRRVPARFPYEGEICWYEQPQIGQMIDQLYARRGQSDERQEFQRQRLFMELLDHVWEQADWLETSAPDINPAIQRSILYMEQQYDQELTREQLAQIADMSPGYYSSLFRKETGTSPMDRLAEIRIKHAKQMLVSSDKPIREIAQSVGFSTPYYFSSRFKQVVGLPPTAYVQRNQERSIASSLLYTTHLRASISPAAAENRPPERIVGLFLEDYLTVLGIQPIVQYSRSGYYQRYLSSALDGVQKLDVSRIDFGLLRSLRPDLILLAFPDFAADARYEQFAEIAPTYIFQQAGLDWRSTLMSIADLVHQEERAQQVVQRYDEQAHKAKQELADMIGDESVALLRFHFREGLCLYGGPESYTGSVLYEDLGLNMPPLLQEWSRHPAGVVIPIRPESLSQLEADHLLVIVDDAQTEQAQLLFQSPYWTELGAVRNNQVYMGTTDIWMTFGVLGHERKIQQLLDSIRSRRK